MFGWGYCCQRRVYQLLNPKFHILFPPCTVNVNTVCSIKTWKLIIVCVISLSRLCLSIVVTLMKIRSNCMTNLSAVDVTGLLAIAEQFFMFHLFCLVFTHTWFQNPNYMLYIFPRFPPCPCRELFICKYSCYVLLLSYRFCTHGFVVLYAVSLFIKLLRIFTKFALLRLTSLPPVTHPLQVHTVLLTSYVCIVF
jgi:hypothetical protein